MEFETVVSFRCGSFIYNAIAKKLSVGRTTVSTRIKALKDKGLIERIGSDKDGYWKITDR